MMNGLNREAGCDSKAVAAESDIQVRLKDEPHRKPLFQSARLVNEGALRQALVDFLETDDIRRERRSDTGNSVGRPLAIYPQPATDIISYDTHLERRHRR